MASLHVTTPAGTTYTLNLDTININSGSSNQIGWAYLPKGSIIQWGQSGTNEDVYLPISFTAWKISVAMHIGSSDVINIVGHPARSTDTSISFYMHSDSPETHLAVHWIAIGY